MNRTADEQPPLPNTLPRPEGEAQELLRIWATPRGWRLPSAVNNTVIGLLYVGAAFGVGVLGLLAYAVLK